MDERIYAQGLPDQVSSHFDGLVTLADRAEKAADRLQRFVDRFHGCGAAKGQSTVAPVPSGHLGQLSRLSDLIGQIENTASEIDRIG